MTKINPKYIYAKIVIPENKMVKKKNKEWLFDKYIKDSNKLVDDTVSFFENEYRKL